MTVIRPKTKIFQNKSLQRNVPYPRPNLDRTNLKKYPKSVVKAKWKLTKSQNLKELFYLASFMYKKRVAMDQSNGITDGKLSKVANFREISANKIMCQIVAF